MLRRIRTEAVLAGNRRHCRIDARQRAALGAKANTARWSSRARANHSWGYASQSNNCVPIRSSWSSGPCTQWQVPPLIVSSERANARTLPGSASSGGTVALAETDTSSGGRRSVNLIPHPTRIPLSKSPLAPTAIPFLPFINQTSSFGIINSLLLLFWGYLPINY